MTTFRRLAPLLIILVIAAVTIAVLSMRGPEEASEGPRRVITPTGAEVQTTP